MIENNYPVELFFNKIRHCEIAKIEIYNFVELLSDNFNRDKLMIILDDFEFYLFNEKEEFESELSHQDIINAINELNEKKKDIPYIKLIDIKDKNGKPLIEHPEKSNIVDLEKLLFPYEFFCCYQFKNFLIKKINTPVKDNDEIKVPDRVENNLVIKPERLSMKIDRHVIEDQLRKLNFLDLKLVKDLEVEKIKELIKILIQNKLPYQIAMLDFLGFLKYLEESHFRTKLELHKALALIFKSHERAVRGNINNLVSIKEKRYTSHIHMEIVKRDYLLLK